MVIRKSGKGFVVKSKSGKTLGKHKTKASATRQLRAIEASKARRNKK